MSEIENDVELENYKLDALKAEADRIGLKYHPNIGIEKLNDRIKEHLVEMAEAKEKAERAQVAPTPAPAKANKVVAVEESAQEEKARIRKELMKLVRIRVTCMNPLKKEWEGEIFTTGNALIGTVKKFVPFNVGDGWHVPQIILNQIQQRKCQVFATETTAQGQKVRRGRLINEFAVEIMPPLTPAELKELADRQAATHAIDRD